MNRLLCALLFLALSLPGALAQNPAPSRPNILFILTDDHRPDGIAALGNPHIQTPHLDRLVEQGTAFTRAYCLGSMQGAVCLPSRSMIQMGRSLFHLPAASLRQPFARFAATVQNQVEGRDWVLLPRLLKTAGYETFHVGKQGNECRPSIEAYDHNIVRDDRGEAARATSSQGHADAVIQFLQNRSADRPFFIYLAPPVPHDPRVAPPEFMKLYEPDKIPLPPSFMPVHPFDNGEMTVRDEKLAPWPRTPEVIRRHLADYYACITCFDHHLGRILQCLRQRGQFDQTVLIFAGDNGLSLGDHGLMGKQNLYEFGGMHVPLILAGPAIPHGRSQALVYLLDLFPTICELAGIDPPPLTEGRSLLPLLKGEKTAPRSLLFTAYGRCQRAVRDDRWKLIRYPLVDQTQLFDLQADPHELQNLATRPEHAATLTRMMGLLEQLQKQYHDPVPLQVPNPKDPRWSPPR